MTRLPDVKTTATRQEMLEVFWKAWVAYFNAIPKKESIWVLLAQSALETGHWRSMHCYNLGNVKSRPGDGFDYCYFACNEILNRKSAERYQAKSPQTSKITKYRNDGKCIIWFYPDHPGCRFRAFKTLQEGASDHLALLVKRFHMAWPAVAAGDPVQFSHLLRKQGYYTADEASYTRALTRVFGTISKDSHLDYSKLPIMTESDREEIRNLVRMSLRKII